MAAKATVKIRLLPIRTGVVGSIASTLNNRISGPRQDDLNFALPLSPGTSKALRLASNSGVARMSVSTRSVSRYRFSYAITRTDAEIVASPDSSHPWGNKKGSLRGTRSLFTATDVRLERAGEGSGLSIERRDFELMG